MVAGKKFPYTAKGKMAAKKASAKMDMMKMQKAKMMKKGKKGK
jgi:hypothetical protein